MRSRDIKVGQRYAFDRKGHNFTATVVHKNKGLVRFEDSSPTVGYSFLPVRYVKRRAT